VVGDGIRALREQVEPNREIAVSTLPLSGIGDGRIQSKALIRSVLTITSASPKAGDVNR
jgi:hypothetical protein